MYGSVVDHGTSCNPASYVNLCLTMKVVATDGFEASSNSHSKHKSNSNNNSIFLDLVEGKDEGEGDGDAHDAREEQPAGEVGLHFVKLRPEPVTGENMRSLVQVNLSTT